MDDVIVVERRVDEEGVMHLHLMSNDSTTLPFPDGRGKLTQEAGAWHYRAVYPFSGSMEINCEGWPMPKVFVLWNLSLCESVKRALYEAAMEYEKLFNDRPQFAFIRKMPKGVENGVEVGSLMLFEADWMACKCVAVGWHYR